MRVVDISFAQSRALKCLLNQKERTAHFLWDASWLQRKPSHQKEVAALLSHAQKQGQNDDEQIEACVYRVMSTGGDDAEDFLLNELEAAAFPSMESYKGFDEGLVDGEGKELLGALMFTCTARDEAADAKAFEQAFPGAPPLKAPQ